MQLIFNLKNTDGTDRTGLQLLTDIYIRLGGTYTKLNNVTQNVVSTPLSDGDYELSFTEPSEYEYLRIHIKYDGAILKRFTVYPEPLKNISKEDIAQSVWDYTGSTYTNIGVNNNNSVFRNIARAVWNQKGSSDDNDLDSVFNGIVAPLYYNLIRDIWKNIYINSGTGVERVQENYLNYARQFIWSGDTPGTVTHLSSTVKTDLCNAIWGRTSADLANPSTRDKRTLTDYEHSYLFQFLPGAIWSHGTRQLTSATLLDGNDPHAVLATVGSEMTLTSAYDTTKLSSAALAEAFWSYDTRQLTSAEIDSEQAQSLTVTSTLESLPSSSDIALELLKPKNLYQIATTVLTTDVGTLDYDPDASYTLKHLIMASQRSRVVEGYDGKTLWEILNGDSEGTVIATREITLNDNGAIKTVDQFKYPDEGEEEEA